MNKALDVLIGLDDAVASALFKDQFDLTVSSRCAMELLYREGALERPAGHVAERDVLLILANELDDIQKDHCYQALLHDRMRALQTLAQLSPFADYLDKKGYKPS